MYNKSFRGYKSNRYKFPRSYGKRSVSNFFEILFSDLKNIRLLIIVLAVVVIAVAIIVGFSIKEENPTKPNENISQQVNISDDSQLLNVVNRNNPLESTFVPQLGDYKGHKVNVLALNPLKDIINGAKADNVDLKINTAYVSFEQQNEKYQETYKAFLNSGNYSKVTAEAKAQSIVPKGGNSEHQTGLLFEFATSEGDKNFQDTAAYKWLEKNCFKYGFVIRYTDDKKPITLFEGNPSLFRYVGKENAEFMRALNMCLDEYNKYISARE